MTPDGPPPGDAATQLPASERFAVPYRFPYHLGLYMAVNAIPGCFVLIDGPDCVYRKAEWIHGKHDSRSTLLDACGRHRVVSTLMHSGELIKSTGEWMQRRMRRLAQLPEVELILVNTMPHVQIIGTQYDKLIAEVEDEVARPIFEVPSRALEGDWLDGYAETLATLGQRLALDRDVGDDAPARERVAIIGLLMDRTEADHTANVAELERLVRALGLDPVSTWLSDRPITHLAQAGRAGTLVALPHGVEAARALAQRTGAQVVEVGQPFGVRGTVRMLRALARATDRERQAESVIDAELRELAPRLEWLVPSFLFGRRLVFCGDPTLFDGLLHGTRELGMEVLHLSSAARRPTYGVELDPSDHGTIPPLSFAPARVTLARQTRGFRGQVDLVIAGHDAPIGGAEIMPFGFPNFYRHALYDAPFLGFRGWLWFVQEMANWMARRP